MVGREEGNLKGRCRWGQWSLLIPLNSKGQGGCWNLEAKGLCGEGCVTETASWSRNAATTVDTTWRGAGQDIHRPRSPPLTPAQLPQATPTWSHRVRRPGKAVPPPGHRTRWRKPRSGSEKGNRLIKRESKRESQCHETFFRVSKKEAKRVNDSKG